LGNGSTMPWSADDENTLCRMWADGYSASEIGVVVGRSRNSCIGKVHRLGLSERSPHAKRKAARVNRPQAPRPLRIASVKPLIAYSRPKKVKLEVPLMEKPVSLNVQLMELKPGRMECRWIEGEPTSGMCGHVVAPGRSYCPFHAAIAYLPRTQTNSTRSSSQVLENVQGREAA
jgi:GcrA cell cycle regulator